MSTHTLSIDFGSAYTKVALRHSLKAPSDLITEETLVMDPQHFCIPTLVAVAERASGTRWAFGPNATQIVEGNGIRVYRNWKSQLFRANQARQVISVGRSRTSSAGGYGHGFPGAQSATPGATEEIRDVTVRYFKWLRKFLAGPCQRLGVRDLGIVPVRLCVPALGTNGRAADDYSPSEALLLEILVEAGWTPDDECPLVTEPEANAIGIYTHGKNVTWSPSGPRGKKFIHFQKMIDFGGYLPALRSRSLYRAEQPTHCVLVIDVGAFTTDLAFLEFDLDQEDKPPSITCESQAEGVSDLDRDVLAHLPGTKATQVAGLDSRRREELKRSLYVDEAPYQLEGNMPVGTGSEGSAIQQCVLEFVKRVREVVTRFIRQHQITQLHEVIFTGGGNLIPRVCSNVASAILKQKLGTRGIHLPTAGVGPNSVFHHNQLDSLLVRGSSAIGGASVYFERRFW